MLQAEATSEMLIYAIIGKKEKKSKSFFLNARSSQIVCVGDLSIFFPLTVCSFRARLMWWHARQSARKQWIMEKNLEKTHTVGMCSTAQRESFIWAQLISAGSLPCQQDPGWLLLAHPPVPSVFWIQKELISSGASPCRASFCLGLSGG